MGIFADLLGTTGSFFKLGIAGVRLKNDAGDLAVRNNADGADAAITTSKLNNSGDVIVINSDAAGAGADWKMTIARPAAGMTAALTFTMPPDAGTNGQALIGDGTGNLAFASVGNTALCDKLDTTSVAFGTASPIAMMATGIGDILDEIEVIIDTEFDGTPALSIGIAGMTSKYMATTQVDLTAAARTVFKVSPGYDAQGIEAIIATYAAGGASVGAARIIVHYATPA
jgi:hypothetical protein